MKRSIGRIVLVVVATIVMVAFNGLQSVWSPSGKNVGDISDQFQNFFTPAGYVFSIWGLIYAALIAFTIYQALPAQRNHPTLARIDILYIVSCAFNAAWMVIWMRELFVLSLVAMVGILVTLIAIYVRLNATRSTATKAESWLLHWPFSVYLGWITVATVANTTVVLQHLGWKGGGIPEPVWGAIMLVVAMGIVVAATFRRRDKAYVLVLAWAAFGIAVKYKATLVVMLTGSIVGTLMLLAAGYYTVLQKKAAA